jgi:putative transposase
MKNARHPLYARHRFPPEVISHAVWLYFRFPLSLRMIEEMLAARGILISHETVRQWAMKFGQNLARQMRRRQPMPGDKWHLDEVAINIAGRRHWLWRVVDQHGLVLDVLVQSSRDAKAAKRLLRKLLKKQGTTPRVMITDKLASYAAAKRQGRRDTKAAKRLLTRLMKKQGMAPKRIITDTFSSYGTAKREVMPRVDHWCIRA